MQALEPIDEVKAQVHKNTDTMSHLQATVEEIKEESKQISVEIGEILHIIKELKQDVKAKGSSASTRSTIKKFLGKSKSYLKMF